MLANSLKAVKIEYVSIFTALLKLALVNTLNDQLVFEDYVYLLESTNSVK